MVAWMFCFDLASMYGFAFITYLLHVFDIFKKKFKSNQQPQFNVATTNNVAGILTHEEKENFLGVFEKLVVECCASEEFADMPKIRQWLKTIMKYNVPHGKKTRGLLTVKTYKVFTKNLTGQNMSLAYVLGWCVEILQAFALLFDDLMDRSEMRRGQKCWYLKREVGSGAVNDGVLLEHTVYAILKKYFKDQPYYTSILQAFLDTTLKTAYGQALDTQMGDSQAFSQFTMETYKLICKYKTSYYTFCLPIKLGLIMAGIKNGQLYDEMEMVLLAIGHLFQVQDDYLDCYGDPEVTGKAGTDIQDSKCTFLLVKALERVSIGDRQVLLDNIGKDDPKNIQVVKKFYEELEIPRVYREYEEEQLKDISGAIKELEKHFGFPSDFLQGILCRLSGRQA